MATNKQYKVDMREEAKRVEAAYRAAGLTRGPCGVVVRYSQFGILVADDQYTENYDDADQAIADLDRWRG